MKLKNFLQGPITTLVGLLVTLGSVYATVFIPAVEIWHGGIGCLIGLLLWFAPDPPTISNLLLALIQAIKDKFLK